MSFSKIDLFGFPAKRKKSKKIKTRIKQTVSHLKRERKRYKKIKSKNRFLDY